jgi:hypothetical protein
MQHLHLYYFCKKPVACNYNPAVPDTYEDPAMVILKELWKRLKITHHLHLVVKY